MRLAIVGLGLLFTVFLVATTLLLPSYFLSTLRSQALQEQRVFVEKAKEVRSKDSASIEFNALKDRIAILRNMEHTAVYGILEEVVSQQVSGVFLNGFFFTQKQSGEWVLSITVISNTRDALLSFSNRLQQTGVFTSVELPVSNLASNRDIAFTITASKK